MQYMHTTITVHLKPLPRTSSFFDAPSSFRCVDSMLPLTAARRGGVCVVGERGSRSVVAVGRSCRRRWPPSRWASSIWRDFLKEHTKSAASFLTVFPHHHQQQQPLYIFANYYRSTCTILLCHKLFSCRSRLHTNTIPMPRPPPLALG